MRIAVVAGESQVFAVVSSAMLASNDVLDVIGEERLRVLRKVAVFAAMIRTFTDGLPKPLVHQAARPSAKSRRSFCLQNGNEISDTDHCLILVTLLRG